MSFEKQSNHSHADRITFSLLLFVFSCIELCSTNEFSFLLVGVHLPQQIEKHALDIGLVRRLCFVRSLLCRLEN